MMNRLMLLCALLLLTTRSPSWAYLEDDFGEPGPPTRVIVGGSLLPTPPGPGKSWQGGSGWRSDMFHAPTHERYFGRRDYVSYELLLPERDLPVEQGTLEISFKHDRQSSFPTPSDTLIAFSDERGEIIFALTVTYGQGEVGTFVVVYGADNVWGTYVPLPTIALGHWSHLAVTWGSGDPKDNRIYFNGRDVSLKEGSLVGQFAPLVQKTRAVRVGLGAADEDPAFHSLIDGFRFSAQVKKSFDLGLPVP